MVNNTLETDILDRLHAIHQTCEHITATRYFPRDLSRLKLPLVTALPGSAVHSNGGTGIRDSARNFLIQCCAGDFNQGAPTESAQQNAEMLIGVMRELYDFAHRRLELHNQPLPGVTSAELVGDSGIIDVSGKATIIFTLKVTYRHVK